MIRPCLALATDSRPMAYSPAWPGPWITILKGTRMKHSDFPCLAQSTAQRPSRSLQALACSATALALLAVAGCAQVQSTPAGTPFADVVAKFGQPTESCKNADGSTAVLWTQQPFGETAFGTTVGTNGTIGNFEQRLTDSSFERLRLGTWTPEQVLCTFGPPIKIERAGIAEKNEVVWSYRYMQASTWFSLMYVYLGPEGKQVTHFNPGPDPLHTVGGDGRR